MLDDGDADDKIIAVPTEDKRWDDVRDLEDINKHSMKELAHFFETYKNLNGKLAQITVGGFAGSAKAREAYLRARKLYDDTKK
jgi:inorganic pyrophosphatase